MCTLVRNKVSFPAFHVNLGPECEERLKNGQLGEGKGDCR